MSHYLNLETIAPQGLEFFEKLTLCVQNIRQKYPLSSKHSDAVVLASTEMQEFKKLIENFTGANIRWSGHSKDLDYWVICRNLSFPHVLFAGGSYQYAPSLVSASMVANGKTQESGTIDLATGKMSGVFSRLQHDIGVPMVLLRSGEILQADEFAANTLHEVGHIVGLTIYSVFTSATSYLLEGITRLNDGSLSVGERKKYYTTLWQVCSLNEKELSNALEGLGPNGASLEIIDAGIRSAQKQFGVNLALTSAFEQIADQYAARFGAGRALVLALDKLNRMHGKQGLNSKRNLINAAVTISSGAAALAAVTGGPVTLGASLLYFYAIGKISATSEVDQTYGPRKMRYERILQDNVAQIKIAKSEGCPASVIDGLIEQNDAIRQVLKDYTDKKDIIEKITYLISPRYKNQVKDAQYLSALETLANNPLFELSEKLKRV